MSEETFEKIIIEEQKNAFDHLRFLETKRDRLVLGCLTASGAVLAFIAKILSKDDFYLTEASAEFSAVLFILCVTLSILSWFLHMAYVSLSPVMKHYEDVIAVTRSILYGENEKKPIKNEKPLIEWINTRKNKEITERSTSISGLSQKILCLACWFWFLAGLCIIFLCLFAHCYCFVP